MINVTGFHTCATASVNLITPGVLVTDRELLKLANM
jgi:hypothetical protein